MAETKADFVLVLIYPLADLIPVVLMSSESANPAVAF
jgi:hypothetical protein